MLRSRTVFCHNWQRSSISRQDSGPCNVGQSRLPQIMPQTPHARMQILLLLAGGAINHVGLLILGPIRKWEIQYIVQIIKESATGRPRKRNRDSGGACVSAPLLVVRPGLVAVHKLLKGPAASFVCLSLSNDFQKRSPARENVAPATTIRS